MNQDCGDRALIVSSCAVSFEPFLLPNFSGRFHATPPPRILMPPPLPLHLHPLPTSLTSPTLHTTSLHFSYLTPTHIHTLLFPAPVPLEPTYTPHPTQHTTPKEEVVAICEDFKLLQRQVEGYGEVGGAGVECWYTTNGYVGWGDGEYASKKKHIPSYRGERCILIKMENRREIINRTNIYSTAERVYHRTCTVERTYTDDR